MTINNIKALEIIKNKLDNYNNQQLMEVIDNIYEHLTDAQIKILLDRLEINLLSEIGIDEKRLDNIIKKINDGEYYITQIASESNNYWDDYEYEYFDQFEIIPILEEAIEYCYTLFEEGTYEKVYEIGKKLLALEINFIEKNMYDDEYEDCECYNLESSLYYFDYSIDINRLKKIMLTIIINKEYSYVDLIWIINLFSIYDVKILEEDLAEINADTCERYIRKLLIDDLKRNNISVEHILILLNYIDEEALFKQYAYELKSIRLFKGYFDYLNNKNKDVSFLIRDALKLFSPCAELEKFARYAVELDDKNEDYKIILFNCNPNNIANFFELYRIKDEDRIISLLKDDYYLSLATLNFKYISKLQINELLFLLELLYKKYDYSIFDERTIQNIDLWFDLIDVNIWCLNDIYNIALDKLELECNYILGKRRKSYDSLAKYVYRLDRLNDFKYNLKQQQISYYSKYTAYIRELNSSYSLK